MRPTPPKNAALRRGRVSISAQPYIVTAVTANRHPLFRDLWLGRAVVRAMRELAEERLAITVAFVVMPDHVHWLLELGAMSLSDLVKRFKGRAARRVNLIRNRRGRVWQPAFHDHALRKEERVIDAARYIIANPVRAGLVKSIGDYPLWDCVWL